MVTTKFTSGQNRYVLVHATLCQKISYISGSTLVVLGQFKKLREGGTKQQTDVITVRPLATQAKVEELIESITK